MQAAKRYWLCRGVCVGRNTRSMAGRSGRRADATTAALISTLHRLACLRWLVRRRLPWRIGARRGGARVRGGMAGGVGLCIASPMMGRDPRMRPQAQSCAGATLWRERRAGVQSHVCVYVRVSVCVCVCVCVSVCV